MKQAEEKRQCVFCGDPVRGRKDKKFCDDLCRNAYNNNQYAEKSNTVRRINRILLKNRNILEKFLVNEKPVARVSRLQLSILGFAFNYYTHTRINNKDTVYRYCYEFGIAEVEKDKVIVIRNNRFTEL